MDERVFSINSPSLRAGVTRTYFMEDLMTENQRRKTVSLR
jgi:hypothetical protein